VPSVTFDSNVYISALVFRKKALRILDLAIEQGVEIAISDEIVEETIRVLREKFHWSEERIEEARATMSSITRHVAPTEKLDVVKSDPDDNKVVACAVAAGSDYLVTGDNDILSLGSWGKTQMITPSDFLAIMTGDRS
jgi:putative PIN family toxin of toxin-antitoxin system